jgi:Zn-dependent protease
MLSANAGPSGRGIGGSRVQRLQRRNTLSLFQNINLVDIVSRALALLLGLTIHEFAHAWTANKLGDPTPRLHGRVTLNPLAHLDPLGTFMLVLAMIGVSPIGWGKPVPINPYYMRWGRRGVLLTSFAGPLSNLILALIIAVIVRIAWTVTPTGTANVLMSSPGLVSLIFWLIVMNVSLAIFNLLPIPPLDGFGILEGLVPPSWDRVMAFLRQYGMWILLFLLFFGGVAFLVGPLYQALAFPLLKLAGLM